MNIELSLDFSQCIDPEKCKALITVGLTGDPVFKNDGTPEMKAIFVVPESTDELWTKLKGVHKGNVARKISKATRSGFVSRYFNYFNHIDEIVEIQRSLSVRGGKQISSYIDANRSEFGPTITGTLPDEKGLCDHHSVRYWGVFKPVDADDTGTSANGKKLIAFIRLFKLGDVVWYNLIIGHGDYLKQGSMHKMHTDLMESYIGSVKPPKYINYGPGDVEERMWKREALFENMNVVFDDLKNYYNDFQESLRSQFKNDINLFISNDQYSRAEILVRLLRFYPSYSLKSRITGKLKRMFAS